MKSNKMLGLHKHELDFEILETGNTKTLVFLDSSSYMEEPERPLIEITMPGYTKYFLTNIRAKQVNTFNSSTIGLNQVLLQSHLIDLPDGIWQFKYKICPYDYVYKIKKVMRMTMLINKLKSLYNEIELSECAGSDDKELESMLVKIHILMEGAKAAVEKNSRKAQKYYQLADKLIQKALDKFCKNCK